MALARLSSNVPMPAAAGMTSIRPAAVSKLAGLPPTDDVVVDTDRLGVADATGDMRYVEAAWRVGEVLGVDERLRWQDIKVDGVSSSPSATSRNGHPGALVRVRHHCAMDHRRLAMTMSPRLSRVRAIALPPMAAPDRATIWRGDVATFDHAGLTTARNPRAGD